MLPVRSSICNMRIPFWRLACTLCIAAITGIISCETKKSDTVDQQQLSNELSKINALLHDTAFAASMAVGQEATYYASQSQPAGNFFAGPDSLIKKSLKEDKIAINLAGFYAVECGIGALMSAKGRTLVEWLKKIADQSIDSSDGLLLNRFANATWKISQPFRSLERIALDNFIVARLLSEEEIKKDAGQINAAAVKLLDSLNSEDAKEVQLETIVKLLRSKVFAEEMAACLEAAYNKGEGKPVPPFTTETEDTASVTKSARSEKIAINLVGF